MSDQPTYRDALPGTASSHVADQPTYRDALPGTSRSHVADQPTYRDAMPGTARSSQEDDAAKRGARAMCLTTAGRTGDVALMSSVVAEMRESGQLDRLMQTLVDTCETGNVATLGCLLEAALDVLTSNVLGRGLTVACQRGHEEAAAMLCPLVRRDELEQALIMCATRNVEVGVRTILAHSHVFEGGGERDATAHDGLGGVLSCFAVGRALTAAASGGHAVCVELLLACAMLEKEQGAIDQALRYASAKGFKDCSKLIRPWASAAGIAQAARGARGSSRRVGGGGGGGGGRGGRAARPGGAGGGADGSMRGSPGGYTGPSLRK